MELITKNLKLVQADEAIYRAALNGNQAFSNILMAEVPDDWTEFGIEGFNYCLNMFLSDKDNRHWLSYFPIHITDNKLIGSGGYKGRPSDEGIIEFGYEIAPAYRDRGYATEYSRAMIDHAFSYPEINVIIAHTLAFENPSTSVLKKCGLQKVDEINDPEDGLIWKWEIKRYFL